MTSSSSVDLLELRRRQHDLRAEAATLQARASLATWRLAVMIEIVQRNVAWSRRSRTERRYKAQKLRESGPSS